MTESIVFPELLTLAEIETLIVSVLPNQKAIIMAKKLKELIIINQEILFSFDRVNVLYDRPDDNIEVTIYHISTLLIEKSYYNLSYPDRETLNSSHKNKVDKIFSNAFIKSFFPQLTKYLTNNEINFADPHLKEIHFKNGFWDFNDNSFKSREYGRHYINAYINRNYEEANEEFKRQVFTVLRKIYPNEDDLNYLLQVIAIALTGHSVDSQTITFLLGKGSSGKSTLMKLIKALVQGYLFELPKEFFVKNYSKLDKVINTYREKPFIRFSWINEPIDTKMNESLYKDFVEGLLQATQLYKDGCLNFNHYSKVIGTSNTMPCIKLDSGVERRTEAYTTNSLFTDKSELVDEAKHIYLTDEKLIEKFSTSDNLLNAFFQILTTYANDWMTKTKVHQQTKNFKDTKNEVLSSNDIIGDFIDRAITITGDLANRIGKEQMYNQFKFIYPKSYATQQQLIHQLKDRKINYSCDLRCENVKGCFTGVSFKDSLTNDCLIQVEEKYTTEYVNGLLENEKRLKEKIQELESKLAAKPKLRVVKAPEKC